MTEQEQQLEIAKFVEPQQAWEIFEDIYIGATLPYKKLVGYRYPAHTGWILAPDYLHDLNAMHEAEACLTQKQGTSFGLELNTIMERDFSKSIASPHGDCDWHATAAQRAEALLRTIGKWKD